MVLPASNNNEELSVIWLAAPSALLPSNHPIAIRPIPIAVSATLATLIIIVLTILYNRKPKHANATHESVELARLENNIRVVRSTTTPAPPITTFLPVIQTHPATAFHSPALHLQRRNDVNSCSSPKSAPLPDDTPVIETYHNCLKDIRGMSCCPSVHDPPSPAGDSYTIPSYYDTAGGSNQHVGDTTVDAQLNSHNNTPASSEYSVSLDPTPTPSRQNSLLRREPDGAWTRLRLGSEYDGDRTFVPSEVNLRLGKSKGKASCD